MSSVATSQNPSPSQIKEWRSRGPTALAASIASGSGPLFFVLTSGVFVKPTMEATGWSTAEVLIGPIIALSMSILGPAAGRLPDINSPRLMVFVALVLYATLLALFAWIPISKVTYYGLAASIGIVGAIAGQVPISKAMSSWFSASAVKRLGSPALAWRYSL